ncbi:MAG: hypothetical protein HQM06_09770 [Magnetococcales bacterium]|nr:hypothetical protein [Magnetococcales bacterium]
MNSKVSNPAVEQIARIICRDDVIRSIEETVESIDDAFTEESIHQAYPELIKSSGKKHVQDVIVAEIVDRSWEDYVETAMSIMNVFRVQIPPSATA